jgi:trk system potassium uptake protein TrkH
MIIGAGSLSTGGGIKWLRLGVLLKGITWQVKSFILPGSAIMPKKIHHITDLKITDDVLRITGAFLTTYLVVYIISVVITLIYYNDIARVIFEVASATSNVGLSTGIMTPTSPILVKIVFIIDFWMGRLEIWPVLLLIAITINSIIRR